VQSVEGFERRAPPFEKKVVRRYDFLSVRRSRLPIFKDLLLVLIVEAGTVVRQSMRGRKEGVCLRMKRKRKYLDC
jgi:hypothetical protein